MEGYFFGPVNDVAACTKCGDNADTCKSATEIETCGMGYYLNTAKACV